MSDWRTLLTPPEGHRGQLAYTFLIRILSTSFISVSIFSVCCYSRVSISMVTLLYRERPAGTGIYNRHSISFRVIFLYNTLPLGKSYFEILR